MSLVERDTAMASVRATVYVVLAEDRAVPGSSDLLADFTDDRGACQVPFGFGVLVIRRGLIIEPPAFINRIATLVAERAARLAPQ